VTCAMDARPTRHLSSYSLVALFLVYHTSFHCGHESAEKQPDLNKTNDGGFIEGKWR
jgi:hypothetical protein